MKLAGGWLALLGKVSLYRSVEKKTRSPWNPVSSATLTSADYFRVARYPPSVQENLMLRRTVLSRASNLGLRNQKEEEKNREFVWTIG
jgi:hypothetical protein